MKEVQINFTKTFFLVGNESAKRVRVCEVECKDWLKNSVVRNDSLSTLAHVNEKRFSSRFKFAGTVVAFAKIWNNNCLHIYAFFVFFFGFAPQQKDLKQ